MITVFTPTYNRYNTLPRLYDSLLRQTYTDFEWVIVDDGSTDDTDILMKNWQAEEKINIHYSKQSNGGKHRAINKGLDLAQGELFFIVDSDDYLPSESLQSIWSIYTEIKDHPDFIGLCGFKGFSETKKIHQQDLSTFIIDSDSINIRHQYGIVGDMAEVFKTQLFRNFKFPDIQGEKFVAESIVWNKMAKDYKVRYFDKIIYICEYLPEGLSVNSIKNRRKNPKYATLLYQELSKNPKAPLKFKLKSIINYWRFFFCRSKNIRIGFKELGLNFYTMTLLSFGFLYYLKDFYNNRVKVPQK